MGRGYGKDGQYQGRDDGIQIRAIDGNKLTVTVNCTLDSYYTDSVRVENTITYDDKFREYTDDNWYYEVKVTETNSGVSHTFKVRPVKVVTNVVLGDDVITF